MLRRIRGTGDVRMAVDIHSIESVVLDSELVRTVFSEEQPTQSPLAQVVDANARWNYQVDAGTGVSLTYAFSGTAPSYDPNNGEDDSTYAALDADEMANCVTSMAAWSEVCDVTFTEA